VSKRKGIDKAALDRIAKLYVELHNETDLFKCGECKVKGGHSAGCSRGRS
jgi:hypothetical protein